MKKGLKVALVIAAVLLVAVGIVCACMQIRYLDFKNSVIGNTSALIQDRYGEFDNRYSSPDAEGIYRNTVCSYIVIEKRVGFFGTTSPYLVSIRFDSNGVAYDIFFQPGGLGG